MVAIKILGFILMFCPIFSFGQNSIYPKDTIYIRYDKDVHSKKNLNHPQIGKTYILKI